MSKTAAKDSTLQALLLTDTFEPKFLPLEKSMGLVDLTGSTFIDYAFEFLSYTEVKEIYVLSASHFEEVNEHIQRRWAKHDLPFHVNHIKCSECRSFGDVMRDVDKKAFIKSDFILLQAGVLCNADLKQAIQEHRQRRAKDKNAVITLIYSESFANSQAKGNNSNFLIGVKPVSNSLKYLKHLDNDLTANVNIPSEVLLESDNLTLYYNLIDCNIAICSPQIPPLFSDNFDFETRRDLIREILTNDEILGYEAHVHILSGNMASFVNDYSSYLSMSFRIVERYTFPLVPDLLLDGNGDVNYTWFKSNLYIHKNDVYIAKSARLVKNIIVGQRCRIEENVRLENVVLGNDCHIGAGTEIKNCLIWNNVKIGKHCRILSSILCSNVRISDSVSVGERCVILNDVCLNSNKKVEDGIMVSKRNSHKGDVEYQSLPIDLSTEQLYQLKFDDKRNNAWDISNDVHLIDCFDESEINDFGAGDTPSSQNRLDQQSDENNVSTDEEDTEDENEESFYTLVHDILQRGIDENVDCANLILEINCAKPTFNVSVEKFNEMLLSSILDLSNQKDSFKSFASIIKQLLPIIRNYYKSEESQFHCLNVLEKFAKNNAEFAQKLQFTLNYFYDNDVLKEESILKWASSADDNITAQLQMFIKWLEEAEEESSDEEQ